MWDILGRRFIEIFFLDISQIGLEVFNSKDAVKSFVD